MSVIEVEKTVCNLLLNSKTFQFQTADKKIQAVEEFLNLNWNQIEIDDWKDVDTVIVAQLLQDDHFVTGFVVAGAVGHIIVENSVLVGFLGPFDISV